MHLPRPYLWLCPPLIIAGGLLAGYHAPESLRHAIFGTPSASDLALQTGPKEPGPKETIEDLSALEASYRAHILPIFDNYCFDCHAAGARRGGLALDAFGSIEAMRADRESWKRVRTHLEFRLMPPPDEDQPGDEKIETLLTWIDEAIFPVDPDNPEPGRVTVRRLNRTEYANTLHDLLGIEIDASRLPPDDSGYGFDHIGDVLTLAPAHLERYQEIAYDSLKSATRAPDAMPALDAAGRSLRGDGNRDGDAWFLPTNGSVHARTNLPASGEYRLHVSLSAHQAGPDKAKAAIRFNDREIATVEVQPRHPTQQDFEFTLPAEKGDARIEVAFLNDYYRPEDGRHHDRNLFVHHLRLNGPAGAPPPERPAFYQRWFADLAAAPDPAARAMESLGGFMRLAFRRPVTASEVARFRPLLDAAIADGDTAEEALRLAMEAVLLSPDFLFRELAALASEGAPGSMEAISETDLATRLSYFLWSSTPDERLLELAETGRLRENLAAETARMLADPRADALTEHFFLQWLRVRDIEIVQPDGTAFPDFGPELRQAMRRETLEFCRHLMRENLPVTTLLDADFTFANPQLAAHYGLTHPGGRGFEKIPLAGTPRRGILTHAAVLTLTSHPTRTSPVKRGEWVLDILLDSPPPPPPPNVPSLESQTALPDDAPLRDRLEAHRADPSCSACHALMDGIGYAFEHFDAIGRWRERDGKYPIDSRGALASGEKFATPAELAEILLATRHDDFLNAFSARLLTYALGRGLDYYDRPTVEHITATAGKMEYRPHSFILSIIQSPPFQYRRLP